ncbi:MAG: four helix bundle protein [Chloroflexi bacterium]|nr:four helix bundle protein [Chloroflexota bacterium]
MKSYRDLRVWQEGMNLVVHIYSLTEGFPSKEVYGLTSQMRRAAVSIPSNIAEGHTRESSKQFLYHISVAQASLAELETQIEIAVRLNYCTSEQIEPLKHQTMSLGKQLYALRNALQKKLGAR